jgi:Family of unknown function (DUF6401)
MDRDVSEIVLRLAGETGQVSLAQSEDTPGAGAAVDQHAAEVREALATEGQEPTPGALLDYAHGFVEAAVGRGWSPTGRLDRESLRLAAVCRLVIETQGLGLTL